jgi:hypothetical protein
MLRKGKIDEPKTWERGENRLADLSLLPSLTLEDSLFGREHKSNSKIVEVTDTW